MPVEEFLQKATFKLKVKFGFIVGISINMLMIFLFDPFF
jgi:hypothetical protein